MAGSLAEPARHLYLDSALSAAAVIEAPELAGFTERHHFRLAEPPPLRPERNVASLVQRADICGVIFALEGGLASRAMLRLGQKVLAAGKRLYVFWPREEAVECVDAERLRSFWLHWLLYNIYHRLCTGITWESGRHAVTKAIASGKAVVQRRIGQSGLLGPVEEIMSELRLAQTRATAVHFDALRDVPKRNAKLPGTGVYLRTDFWAPLISGGSYGHTCYVAKGLAEVTENFVCLMANRFDLLDQFGLRQVLVRPAFAAAKETDWVLANGPYLTVLRPLLDALRPAYLYERLCLGNYAAAKLCGELRIPYIVEYNGSEISMRRSFGSGRYAYEDFLVDAENLAFQQATLISTVSEVVRAEIVARGVDSRKVIVNPNGVDPSIYAPMAEPERSAARADLGFDSDDRIIGFIGTYGGWHGIDVLAEALPRICAKASEARFLLIGDGTLKPMLLKKIADHGLQRRVVDVGRVEQRTGARLLGLCDILVSPHSRHMVDTRFFGSPTKVFEYMATGAGIVASDLEQIGVVLSPALRPSQLGDATVLVDDERAVLCRPGDVDQFVEGVVGLVRQPKVAAALGRNARRAAETYYSWDQHVANLWLHLLARPLAGYATDFAAKSLRLAG